MAKRLTARFGSQVRCYYVDTESAAFRQYPDVRRALHYQRLSLPITTINGRICPGEFSPAAIVQEVEQRLKHA